MKNYKLFIYFYLIANIFTQDDSYKLKSYLADSYHSHVEKIMTYNVLNYNGDNDRDVYFRTIIDSVSPDMIVIQELNGINGFINFYINILNVINPNEWSYADFIDQSANNDIALFYKSENFSLINTSLIPTAQTNGTRDVVEWIMLHNESSIIFRVYGVHFKANLGYEDRRRIEMSIMRDYLNQLPDNTNFIVAGDFNVYNYSTEPGFEIITTPGSDNSGQLFDPLDQLGDWHANINEVDCEYASMHTQSTRILDLGDGATGGMDDRFDWILVSSSIINESNIINYIDGSYLSFGNDGNHCNQAINQGVNSSVSQSMADALHAASDHTPVIASFRFGIQDTSTVRINNEISKSLSGRLRWYPNPFNSTTTFKYNLKTDQLVKITIYDVYGRIIRVLNHKYQFAGEKSIKWNGRDDQNKRVSSGIYFCNLEIGQKHKYFKVTLLN